MAELKLTKSELREQQMRLQQLSRYLPTLHLKKMLLQVEVANAQSQKSELVRMKKERWDRLLAMGPLLASSMTYPYEKMAHIDKIEKGVEHVAGADLPFVTEVFFSTFEYDLYDTPFWIDTFVEELKGFRTVQVRLQVADERIAILSKELRDVSIRVNLFEKVLIPRCKNNIKKIKIFLGDLQLASVAQAKVAKAKILESRKFLHEIAS